LHGSEGGGHFLTQQSLDLVSRVTIKRLERMQIVSGEFNGGGKRGAAA
jgi:hypothetical protein